MRLSTDHVWTHIRTWESHDGNSPEHAANDSVGGDRAAGPDSRNVLWTVGRRWLRRRWLRWGWWRRWRWRWWWWTACRRIAIDAQGLVKVLGQARASLAVIRQRRAAALREMNDDMRRTSDVRCVSLVELQRACQPYVDDKQLVPLEMQFLAGIQRIDYLFIYPDTGDLVLAGPAAGFVPDDQGRMVGMNSGRPTLRLDDLVIALRAVRNSERIGCSIDPVPERLARMQTFAKQNSTPATVQVAKSRYHAMTRILGLQDVTVWGAPADSHFARVLLEADIRMKRLSVGVEKSGVRGFKSQLALLKPAGNSMQRWWFVPQYQAVYRDDEGLAFQLTGPRARLLSQDEYADADGNRFDAPATLKTTREFARRFSEQFSQLAETLPAFAELQNLIDLILVAALIEQRQLAARLDWEPALFLDQRRGRVGGGHVPRQVASFCNYKMYGRRLVIGLVSGGVIVEPRQLVKSIDFQPGHKVRLAAARLANRRPQQAKQHPWWWDSGPLDTTQITAP